MIIQFRPLTEFICTLALGLVAIPYAVAGQPQPELKLNTARVSISGTSNIHPFTASTTDLRISRLVLAPADGDRLQSAVRPGGVEAVEIAIKAASLASSKDGLDKNMHKALKASEHPDITFYLSRIEAGAAANTLKAIGLLKIAGVEKEVALPLKVAVNASVINVTGDIALLMTDYGIKPPTAMLGMAKADNKITVTFELALALPQTTF